MLNLRHVALLLFLAAGITVTLLVPPFAQPHAFHDFADTRSWLGIPNAMDVLSNLGFVIVGLLGLFARFNLRALPAPYSRWLTGYSLSLLAVAAGSIYYHLAPHHLGLMWDRAAMTLAFSYFFCFVLASQVSLPLARRLLPPMLLAGLGSTLYWFYSEANGAGDLRFYAAFQFLPLGLAVLMLALFPSGPLSKTWLSLTLLCYVAAKMLETADLHIFECSGFVSGHSLKHLLAALGAWCVIRAITGAAQGEESAAATFRIPAG